MRVCLMIEGQEGVSWDEWVALARACEEHGLEGLFRSDHYSSTVTDVPGSSLDAWATLAALAPLTERIRLGTLVSPVGFRHPSVLAKSALTVDHASGGRVEVGMGAGWMELEHTAYGFDFPDVAARMELLAEQVEIVSRQLTGAPFSFEGRHYRLDGCVPLPPPVQRPRPPLIVGGSGGRGTIGPAVAFADEYNTFFKTVDECAELRAKLDAACREAERDSGTLPLSLMTGCAIGVRQQPRPMSACAAGSTARAAARPPTRSGAARVSTSCWERSTRRPRGCVPWARRESSGSCSSTSTTPTSTWWR